CARPYWADNGLDYW
nr:immunoglobulin heavy chain junction region [Macaca mulatta]MOW77021.1 immunoglobulin heavy chain junction region [Macaca mulatta]MOW78139.1 immunoglobulin heavy chain junction region [Macaca mulatta]MOW78242.1 immunoglobulin heavy chain junction region [Macaca mulatta]MOW78671.1 immunoglobulin heavy chain junction region [Macaca mulatta]